METKIAESEIVKSIEDYLDGCSKQELLDLHNFIFSEHISNFDDVAWGEYSNTKKHIIMSIAKNAQERKVMTDIQNGKYTSVNKRGKFANFGSVVTDSLFAQQAEAQKRLAEIKSARLTARKFA